MVSSTQIGMISFIFMPFLKCILTMVSICFESNFLINAFILDFSVKRTLYVWDTNSSQSLMASNFAAFWPTDLKFSALKDLSLFSTESKAQEASSILKVGFALSKWPHFHRVYLVTVCKRSSIVVYLCTAMLTINRSFANL